MLHMVGLCKNILIYLSNKAFLNRYGLSSHSFNSENTHFSNSGLQFIGPTFSAWSLKEIIKLENIINLLVLNKQGLETNFSNFLYISIILEQNNT